MKVTVIPIILGVLRSFSKFKEKETGGIGNQEKNGDHTDQSIVEILGDLLELKFQ